MSSPDRAVAAVEQLKTLGYEAMVDLPAEDDTSSFVSVWSTSADHDADGVASFVHEVDQEAIELPDAEEDGGRR
jgi:hypothetical protein